MADTTLVGLFGVAVGGGISLVGVVVSWRLQTRQADRQHAMAVADADRERRRQNYVSLLTSLENCRQLLFRLGHVGVLSKEAFDAFNASVEKAITDLNSSVAAIRLDRDSDPVPLDDVYTELLETLARVSAVLQSAQPATAGSTFAKKPLEFSQALDEGISEIVEICRSRLDFSDTP